VIHLRELVVVLQTSAHGGPTLSTRIEACVEIRAHQERVELDGEVWGGHNRRRPPVTGGGMMTQFEIFWASRKARVDEEVSGDVAGLVGYLPELEEAPVDGDKRWLRRLGFRDFWIKQREGEMEVRGFRRRWRGTCMRR
jgi:hypothetical protein